MKSRLWGLGGLVKGLTHTMPLAFSRQITNRMSSDWNLSELDSILERLKSHLRRDGSSGSFHDWRKDPTNLKAKDEIKYLKIQSDSLQKVS
jgi:hypothetical protein